MGIPGYRLLCAYFKIWREGDKVFLGGEGAGISRATTYVLEALGCRYIWPGETGKIIPKREAITLPEIDVADATPFAIRRMRLYGWPEFPDRAGNRDFWRWHGMNDTKTMTTDRPGDADGYQWASPNYLTGRRYNIKIAIDFY